MTKNQKIFLLQWLILFLLMVPFVIFFENILNEWGTIKWPSIIFVLLFISIVKDKRNIADTRSLTEYAKDYLWVKLYVAIYALIVTAIAIYLIITGKTVEHHVEFLIWAFSFLIIPPLFGQQLERFIQLGDKSNKAN